MRLRFASILLLLPVAARSWPQSTAIPDTPAGHTLRAWLDALDSGDGFLFGIFLVGAFVAVNYGTIHTTGSSRWNWQSVSPSNGRSSTLWWGSFTN